MDLAKKIAGWGTILLIIAVIMYFKEDKHFDSSAQYTVKHTRNGSVQYTTHESGRELNSKAETMKSIALFMGIGGAFLLVSSGIIYMIKKD